MFEREEKGRPGKDCRQRPACVTRSSPLPASGYPRPASKDSRSVALLLFCPLDAILRFGVFYLLTVIFFFGGEGILNAGA